MTNSPLPPQGQNPRGLENAEEVNGLDLWDSTAAQSEPGRAARRPARWLFLVAGIVVIVLAIVAVVGLRQGSTAKRAEASVAQEVADAKDVKSLSKDTDTGTVNLKYSRSVDAFSVQLDDVPDAGSGQEYQVSVTSNDSSQHFERVGLLGAKPGDDWYGFRGVDDVLSVHVTVVAEGGEDAPEQDDLAEIEIPAK